MRCVYTGYISGGNADTTITLSSFNYHPTSEEDYIVLIDTGYSRSTATQWEGYMSAFGDGAYIKENSKTSTEFIITRNANPYGGGYPNISYQVIALK